MSGGWRLTGSARGVLGDANFARPPPVETWTASLHGQPPLEEELERFRAALDEQWQAIPVVLAGSGLRIGELLGLRLSDVNLLRRTISVERQRLQPGKVAPLKSKASRYTVPAGRAAPKQRSRRSEAQEPQAAFLVHQNDRFVTVAVSDDVARRVNDLERANREGPCLDAIVDDAPQLEPDLTSTSQWPQLARQVLLDSPVRGVAGFRIIIEQKKVGALNIFSDRSGALTMASASHGIILASFGP